MKCENCSQINKEDSIYCEQCGKKLQNNKLFNEIEQNEEKIKKEKKRFVISSILNYIAILIIYAIIGYIIYLSKTEDEYTATVAAWCAFFFILFFLIISTYLFITSIVSGIVAYKSKKNNIIIINLIILSLLHLPFLIILLRITFRI